MMLTGLHANADKKRSEMEQMIRKPVVAGQFYTGNPTALRAEIEGYLKNASPTDETGDVIALISPHAGYMYSGQVAAYGYSLVRGKAYDAVIVISPSHVEYFDFSSVFTGKAYLTPLGEIPVEQELATLIASKNKRVRADLKGHLVQAFGRGEHALEVQLPFLQVALGPFKLVPIVMGNQSPDNIKALGEVIGEVASKHNVLIVASTDLSHFHNDKTARELDSVFMEKLEAFDPDNLGEALGSGHTEACGGGPTAAVMIAARKLGADRCKVLNYATSGDITGDKSSVVGYVSAAILKSEPATGQNNPSRNKEAHNPSSEDVVGLTTDEKVYLITLARNTIEAQCSGESFQLEALDSPIMKEPRGAFVTLKKRGQLRGCIGYIEAVKPLAEAIQDMAKAAAFNDYRFQPVTADEVPELEIEISVLSPIRKIDDPSEIEVGKHGIIITRGMNRGLLLPQVAPEWGWDRKTFLEHTCTKAGLPTDAWKQPGTQIEVFSAEIFSEKELKLR